MADDSLLLLQTDHQLQFKANCIHPTLTDIVNPSIKFFRIHPVQESTFNDAKLN